MIKITGFEHVSWAANDLEPAQKTLSLFGISPPATKRFTIRM